MGNKIKENKVNLFLDSGAFSAFTQKIEINIQEYIQFIKEHEDCLELYANLDSIGSAEKTWENQKIMERAGLSPLPCFHYGEDFKWLKRYLRKYDHISLGGMVPISSKSLAKWLDVVFGEYICDESGMPKVKVHGFGLTSLRLMLRYPWHSVDSTSWVVTGRLGSIYVPKRVNGEWIYDQESHKIAVSNKSPSRKEQGKHITTLSPIHREMVNDYLKEKGYSLGESTFRFESKDYELQENEKWAGKEKGGKREVETIVVPGIGNDYKLRDEMNIIYFLDLEKSIPPYPRQFKKKRTNSLGVR